MYLRSGITKECYGCFVCIDVCRIGAISIKKKDDMYLYPEIDERKCIKCKKCFNICSSVSSYTEFNYPVSSFAGVINNKQDFLKSSSGGAFKAIIKSVLKMYQSKYTAFYCAGVKYDERFRVINDIVKITNEQSVDVFSKSKYIHSNPVGVYEKCKEILSDENNFLIFTGTPCQVAALQSYIVKPCENILCVDLICHGAPSQYFFDEYVKSIENKHNSKLINYEFRTKKTLENGTNYNRSSAYLFENGVERRVSRLDDDFLLAFYTGKYEVRPSCNSCKYKKEYRVSDITIGDAWGIETVFKELIPTRGVSSIIIVTKKGKCLENYIRKEMKVYEFDYKAMIQNNKALRG